MPQWIEIIGSINAWSVFKSLAWVYFAAFVGRLGSAHAGEVWKSIRSQRNSENNQRDPLIELVGACNAAMKAETGQVSIQVGLSIPGAKFPAVLELPSDNQPECVRILACFVCQLDSIKSAVTKTIEGNSRPASNVFIEVDKNCSVKLSWQSLPDFERVTVHLPPAETTVSQILSDVEIL